MRPPCKSGSTASILVILAAYSSIRSSELLGLQRKHINELQSVIKIEHQLTNYASDDQLFMPPKTDAGIREVPIPKELMQALINHIDRFVSDPSPDALIFTTSNGLPLYKGRKSWWVTANADSIWIISIFTIYDIQGNPLRSPTVQALKICNAGQGNQRLKLLKCICMDRLSEIR